mgnify:FL=1
MTTGSWGKELSEYIAQAVQGMGLRPFYKSQVFEKVLTNRRVEKQWSDFTTHGVHADKIFSDSIKVAITEHLQKSKKPIVIPLGKPLQLRTYPSYEWGGDILYQHIDGMDYRRARAVLAVKTHNADRVERQRKFWEVVVDCLYREHCTIKQLDLGKVVEIYQTAGGR